MNNICWYIYLTLYEKTLSVTQITFFICSGKDPEINVVTRSSFLFMWDRAVLGVHCDSSVYCSQEWSHQSSQAQTHAPRMSTLCFCSSSESWTSQRKQPKRWDSTLNGGQLVSALEAMLVLSRKTMTKTILESVHWFETIFTTHPAVTVTECCCCWI